VLPAEALWALGYLLPMLAFVATGTIAVAIVNGETMVPGVAYEGRMGMIPKKLAFWVVEEALGGGL
jgi:hypothetical protein